MTTDREYLISLLVDSLGWDRLKAMSNCCTADLKLLAAARTYFPLLLNVARAADSLCGDAVYGSIVSANLQYRERMDRLREALAALEAGGEEKSDYGEGAG